MPWIARITKVFRNVLIGFGLGAIATTIYLLVALHLQLPSLSTELMLKQLLGSMSFGAYCGMVALIYDWGKENIHKETVARFLVSRTVLNLLLIIVGYLVTGQVLGWFIISGTLLFGPLAAFLLLYLLIWISFYLYNRKLAMLLNNRLNKG